ncbi:MAG: glycosyltransferase family 9 protein [bacterium]
MKKQKRFLLFRLSSLGDIVLTTFLPKLLKETYPECRIDFITTKNFSDIYKYNPYIDNLIIYDKKWDKSQINKNKKELLESVGKYDYFIDLHNTHRSRFFSKGIAENITRIKKNRVEKLALVYLKKNLFPKDYSIVNNYLNSLTFIENKNLSLETKIYLEGDTTSKINLINKKMPTASASFRIAIAPGAKHFTKRYPAEKLIEFANELSKIADCHFVLLGSNDEIEPCAAISAGLGKLSTNLAGKTNILESVQELSNCDLLVTNDSGLMHIAAARNVPVIAIFGSTIKEFGFAHYRENFTIISVDLKCRPCTHIGRKSCPKGHFNCMNLITSETLTETAKKILKIN